MMPGAPGPSRLWKLTVLAIAAVLAAELLASGIVRAASQELWQALVKEAGAACQIASELDQPRVVWSNPAYESKAALILAGKWPSTRNEGKQAYLLCLFDKQTAKVEIQEIEPKLFK